MGFGVVVLSGLRTLAVAVALAVIGLGAWVQHTVHDVEIRGTVVVDVTRLSVDEDNKWLDFMDAVVDSQIQIWVAIGSGCFAFLAGVHILLSIKVDRFKVSRYILVPVELLSMIVMGGAFAATLTLAIKLAPRCRDLDTASSPDLASFAMLCPLSTGYSIASGVGWFVLAITSTAATIAACHHRREQKACSFEPTASALGMSHGYQAVTPPMPRSTIPTMYDPSKPEPASPVKDPGEEEIGLAIAAAEMGKVDLGIGLKDGEDHEISGPLSLKKPEEVRQMRPARPWSEAPKRKNEMSQ
ncbi:hypothetical protein CC78DRAFT_541720 [Lojkania enalia]|uniref:Transmembrane protein n=1 Tax=Lojkania enalia TaxID=147567 RepID=A0A9P4KF06_9PLEO|nr:hypothetical protein CC78DRAFT_541720 [Didymosphaeria enalia]